MTVQVKIRDKIKLRDMVVSRVARAR